MSAPLTVSASFTAAGDVSDFDDVARRESIKAVIAAEANVAPRHVELLITLASVRITAKITVPTELAAEAAIASLSAGAFSSEAALQAAFETGGVAIEVERISAAPQHGSNETGGEIVAALNDALRSDGSGQQDNAAIVWISVGSVVMAIAAITLVVVLRADCCLRCRGGRNAGSARGRPRFSTISVPQKVNDVSAVSAMTSTTHAPASRARESTTDPSEVWAEDKVAPDLTDQRDPGSIAMHDINRSSAPPEYL